ncbi:hypothetical protein B0H66DRAFT_526596 [Apodospora peruviana]|uniref:Uncharacterized protein n=1 Tax=Apodospora peruviana TaxID=516989 RepID=A0AAE0IQQ3_9PEZI|nr:hypothetical protein B0H66DRAFT_526596 [Apodospora peruviana]
MARLQKRALAGLLPFIFSLLAFTFSLLAVTSPEWASRNQYPDSTDAISQLEPLYTLHRSPFQICISQATIVDDPNNANTNATDTPKTDDQGSTEEDDQPAPPLNYTYTLSCQNYHLFGKNKTSCELPNVVGQNIAPQVGDTRQCQQIHLAGNYQVASSVFLGVALLVSLVVAGVALADSMKFRGNGDNDAAIAAEARHQGHVHHFPKLLALAPTVLFPLTVVGVVTALVAQFYAVEGLIQSAANNSDFASSAGNREHHDPWSQGKALSTYLSLSWFWALLAAWVGWLIWGPVGGSGYGTWSGGRWAEGKQNGSGEKVKA